MSTQLTGPAWKSRVVISRFLSGARAGDLAREDLSLAARTGRQPRRRLEVDADVGREQPLEVRGALLRARGEGPAVAARDDPQHDAVRRGLRDLVVAEHLEAGVREARRLRGHRDPRGVDAPSVGVDEHVVVAALDALEHGQRAPAAAALAHTPHGDVAEPVA